MPHPGPFMPGKESWYPFYKGWVSLRVGVENLNHWTTQPVADRYTNHTILAHYVQLLFLISHATVLID